MRYGSGMGVVNKYTYPENMREAAYKIANVDKVATVSFVADNSTANAVLEELSLPE